MQQLSRRSAYQMLSELFRKSIWATVSWLVGSAASPCPQHGTAGQQQLWPSPRPPCQAATLCRTCGIHTHTRAHIRTHTHKHTYTHTYTHSVAQYWQAPHACRGHCAVLQAVHVAGWQWRLQRRDNQGTGGPCARSWQRSHFVQQTCAWSWECEPPASRYVHGAGCSTTEGRLVA